MNVFFGSNSKRAIAVTSSKDKEAALKQYGADEVIVGIERFEKKVAKVSSE